MSTGIDYPLEETVHILFTTRAFATGAPGTLSAATVAIYEDGTVTPIMTGVLVTEDFNTITGLNMVPVVATAANGFNTGASYHVIIEAGTVDSVSVVGEVVGSFSIARSTAAVDLANVTDGLGAIKAETALIVADTNELQTDDIPGAITALNDVAITDIVSAGAITTLAGAIVNVDLVDTCTTNTDVRGTDGANTVVPDAAGVAPTAIEIRQEIDLNSTKTGYALSSTGADLILKSSTFALAIADAIWDELMAGHITVDTAGLVMNELQDGGRLDALIDSIKAETALIVADTNELQTDDVPTLIAALPVATDIVSAGAITTLTGAIVNVDLVDTCTTNTDVRGTDSAALASVVTEARLSELDAATGGKMANQVDVIETDTTSLNDTKIPDTLSLANINAEVDTALDTAIPASPTSGSINDVLDIQKDATVGGLAKTGTLSTTVMTTDLGELTDDHYNGRIVVFRGGVLDGQATDITDYSGTNGTITMTAVTEAPLNDQAFTIV